MRRGAGARWAMVSGGEAAGCTVASVPEFAAAAEGACAAASAGAGAVAGAVKVAVVTGVSIAVVSVT